MQTIKKNVYQLANSVLTLDDRIFLILSMIDFENFILLRGSDTTPEEKDM